MYNFIDVNEAQETAPLPSEALQLNGEYIENLVPGYRTLHVSGRESLSPEIETFDTGARDGANIKSKRYPERILILKYQLIAKSNAEFRESYNKLGAILNVKDAELVFNDEPDKFFIGTPSRIGEVDPGKNAVTGEIEFLCADPFKYSLFEYEAEPAADEGSVLIDYNGTYKSYPTLEAHFYSEDESSDDGESTVELTGAGDCGYVAFFDEASKIIQLGDPSEEDGETAYPRSQTMMNQAFNASTSWGTAAKAGAVINGGIALPSPVLQNGSVGMKPATYSAAPTDTSASLLKIRTVTGNPYVDYSVTAKTTGRTETSVKVTVAISTSLERSSMGIGTGRELEAHLYIGGAWRSVILKQKTKFWERRKTYTANMAFTVSGLAAATTSLTGIKLKVNRNDSLGQAGILAETACKNLPISAYTANIPETYFLSATGYGSGTGWHGVSVTRNINADAAGDVGATSFTVSWRHRMCYGNSNSAQRELGAFQMQLTDASGDNVCGVRIFKNAAGTSGKIAFYVKGSKVDEISADMSYNNKLFGFNSGAVNSCSITKSSGTFSFSIGGVNKIFNVSSAATAKAAKVTYTFEQYNTSAPLSYNGIYSFKFVKNNCETWKNIPNKFSANDVVSADCKTGRVYLNGSEKPMLGALGNDWEDFYLTPGLNQIGFSYSDWVDATHAPQIKVKYREVFL